MDLHDSKRDNTSIEILKMSDVVRLEELYVSNSSEKVLYWDTQNVGLLWKVVDNLIGKPGFKFSVIPFTLLFNKVVLSFLSNLGVKFVVAFSSPINDVLCIRVDGKIFHCILLEREHVGFDDVKSIISRIKRERPQTKVLGEKYWIKRGFSKKIDDGHNILRDVELFSRELLNSFLTLAYKWFSFSKSAEGNGKYLVNVLPWNTLFVIADHVNVDEVKVSFSSINGVYPIEFSGLQAIRCIKSKYPVESAQKSRYWRGRLMDSEVFKDGVYLHVDGYRYEISSGRFRGMEASRKIALATWRGKRGLLKMFVTFNDVLMYSNGEAIININTPIIFGKMLVYPSLIPVEICRENIDLVQDQKVQLVEYFSGEHGIILASPYMKIKVDLEKGRLKIFFKEKLKLGFRSEKNYCNPYRLLLETIVSPRVVEGRGYIPDETLLKISPISITPIWLRTSNNVISITLINSHKEDLETNIFIHRHPLRAYEIPLYSKGGGEILPVIGRNVFVYLAGRSMKNVKIII